MREKNNVDIVIPVYEEKEHLTNIVRTLNKQKLPLNYELNIIIVDDASQDDTVEYIHKNVLSNIGSLIELNTNSGPAVARNKGCLAGKGEVIILIDADCLPESPNFVMEHILTLRKHDVSCGALHSHIPNSSFWSQYQNEIFEKRARDNHKNNGTMFTTQNLAFTRKHFLTIGGFDEQYFFGFEDRDFLLRSQEIKASIHYTPKACVIHSDQLTMRAICRKMHRAGHIESNIFRKRHLDAYKTMPYYIVDAREHAYLLPLAKYIAPLITRQVNKVDKIIGWEWLPYEIKKIMVKTMTAFCYMEGTGKK